MIGIAKGMWTTLRHFVKKPITVQYPEERLPLPIGYRGLPHLTYDEETGKHLCVVCGLCAVACPTGVIHIDSHRGPDGKKVLDRYDIDATACVFCGLCVEACPFDALTMTPCFEMAGYTRDQLWYDMNELSVPIKPDRSDLNSINMYRIHGPYDKPAGKERAQAGKTAAASKADGAAAKPAARAAQAAEVARTAGEPGSTTDGSAARQPQATASSD